MLENEDILFARSGATVGKTYIHSKEIGKAIFAGYCIRFRFDKSKVLPWFIYFYTKTGRYQLWVKSMQRPAGQPNINKEEFKSFTIPVPSLDVQEKLVAKMQVAQESRKKKLAQADVLLAGIDGFILDQLGFTCEGERQEKAYAVRLKNAYQRCDADYHSPRFRLLRDNLENGKFPAKTIAEICSSIKTGFAAGREVQAFSDEKGIPHVRPLNISPFGELSFESTKYVPSDSVRPKDIIEKSEVLLNNTNSTEWVGKTTVFEGQQRCCCSNHITRLVLKQNLVLPWFLASLLNAIRSTGYLGLLATNFVNQAGINTKTLSEVRIPVADLKLQKDIVKEVIEAKQKAQVLREEAERDWGKAKIHFETQLLGEGTA